ncbi:winged helix-turn-helix domain-containing protein [Vibrio splendidus]|uniref:Transcriptional regulator n=1 Tax=Vibrio splendidus TaxID=29497 RepID=A0ABV4LYL6_VIBSP|nr:winged helix-turn-helix domain-containing protein [Vibrio splendidus]PMO76501.1 transcriptional regulator [Vibrio splendidus]
MWDFRPQAHSQLRNQISGEEKRLTNTESQLLLLLLSNNHRIVTKAEIHNKIWRGKFVSDASITHAIASLRLALHDTVQTQCIIRTAPKVGYFLTKNTITLVSVNQIQSQPKFPAKLRLFNLSYFSQTLILLSLVSVNLLLFWFIFVPSQPTHRLNMSKVNDKTNTFTIESNDPHSKSLLDRLVSLPELNNSNFYITSNKTRVYVSCIYKENSTSASQSVNFSVDIKRPIAKVVNDIVHECQ